MDKVEWLHFTPFLSFFIGFTDNKKAFKKELKKLGVKEKVVPISKGANATTHSFFSGGKESNIIVFEPFTNKRNSIQYEALIVHEIVHVIQHLRERYGELGVEIEAYMTQYLYTNMKRELTDG